MEERDPGYDDWFDEPEPPTQEAGRSGRGGVYDGVDDVWVLPEDEPSRRRARRSDDGGLVVGGVSLTTTQLAIVAAAVLALFFGILAAAGVFNGSKPVAAPTTIVTTVPTVSPSTSTPTVSTTAATVPTTQLRPGDTGKQVKVLQQDLKDLGFLSGKPDGDYGPNTQSAVEQFQSSKGLTADGIVGQQTLNALSQALSG